MAYYQGRNEDIKCRFCNAPDNDGHLFGGLLLSPSRVSLELNAGETAQISFLNAKGLALAWFASWVNLS